MNGREGASPLALLEERPGDPVRPRAKADVLVIHEERLGDPVGPLAKVDVDGVFAHLDFRS